MTDTNSLMYEIKTKNGYDDFSKNKKSFDFSSCSPVSKYYNERNALVFGKIKKMKWMALLLKSLLD